MLEAELAGIQLNASAIKSILEILAERDPDNGLLIAAEAVLSKIEESVSHIKKSVVAG